MAEFSAPIREFLWDLNKPQSLEESTEKIKVSTLLSRVVLGYEKIRNALEYKEEHLWRKNATKRMLKRLFLLRQKEKVARLLIEELIRGGYLPNNEIPANKVAVVHQVIMKYRHFREQLSMTYSFSQAQKYFNWFLNLAACEIEEILNPNQVDEALINLMYRTILSDFDFLIKDTDQLSLEIYLEVRKALLKPDRDLLNYALVKYYFPDWRGDYQKILEKIIVRLPQIKEKFSELTESKRSFRFQWFLKRHKITFTIFRELVIKKQQEIKELLTKPAELKEVITDVCLEKYQRTRKRLTRGAFRAIIFVFFTKMILAILLELPFDYYILGYINPTPLVINVLFPPLLLFFVAILVSKPGVENTKKINVAIQSLIYQGKLFGQPQKAKFSRSRGGFLNTLFYFLYFLTFIISFGLLVYLLYWLEFNIVSSILFFFFLCLVSFLGSLIRRSAKDLLWFEPRDDILRFFWTFFSMPIVRVGRWLTYKFAKINFLVIFLDLIIETPLKTLIELWEGWASFIKEKKEEIF